MSSNESKVKTLTEWDLALQRSTTDAINSYCRVLELHLRAVAEGSNPLAKGKGSDAVQEAAEGLRREVRFLRFLREELPVTER